MRASVLVVQFTFRMAWTVKEQAHLYILKCWYFWTGLTDNLLRSKAKIRWFARFFHMWYFMHMLAQRAKGVDAVLMQSQCVIKNTFLFFIRGARACCFNLSYISLDAVFFYYSLFCSFTRSKFIFIYFLRCVLSAVCLICFSSVVVWQISNEKKNQ